MIALRTYKKQVNDQPPHPDEIKNIPAKDQIIYGHFFNSKSRFYVAAMYDINHLFGFVILDDPKQGEWGDFTLMFMLENGVRSDLEWIPNRFGEIAL